MDLRAKQRITGAVILVTLFVLAVPPMLDGPGEADVPADAAEEGMRRYTIDLNANNPSSTPAEMPAAAPVELPQPESPKPAPTVASPQPLAQPGEAAAPAVAEPKPTPAPAPAPAPAAATNAPAAATPTTAAAQPPAKPAPAPAPRVDSAKPVPAAPGSFAVQLGSFSVRDNADRLVRDMTAKGFAAFVSPIKSGDRLIYRVRVGPTRDRAQAEALAAQLRRIGQSGAIVPIS
jgi:DedD protein